VSEETGSLNPRPRLYSMLRWCFVFLCFYFIFALVNQFEIEAWLERTSRGYLLLGLFVHFLSIICALRIWQICLSQLEGDVPTIGEVITSTAYMVLGKYLPGKVFGMVARAHQLKDRYNGNELILTTLTEQLSILQACLSVLFLCGAFMVTNSIMALILFALGLVLALRKVGVNGKLYRTIIKVLLWLRLDLKIPGNFVSNPRIVTYASISLLFNALTFCLVCLSVLNALPVSPVFAVFCMVGAFMAGYVTVITPAGLGVREISLVTLLVTQIPTDDAIFIALVTRVVMVVGDAILSSLAIFAGFVYGCLRVSK